MSVASPPRPAPARIPSAKVVEDRPLRYPDTASREVMTRRGWWLVLLNFLLGSQVSAVIDRAATTPAALERQLAAQLDRLRAA